MPRPGRIDWRLQVAVFRDFRRLQKVLPVAQRHRVSRPTVSRILQELEDHGFARERRLQLPDDLLALAQEHHLAELREQLAGVADVFHGPPSDREAAPSAAELRGGAAAPRSLTEELSWHLKGIPILDHLAAVAKVAEGEWQDRHRLLSDIADQLTALGGFPVVVAASAAAASTHGFLPALVDALYDDWCGVNPRLSRHPPTAWTSNGSWLQMAPGWPVAQGDPSEHPAMIAGFTAFLREAGPRLQATAHHLAKVRSDLRYVQEALQVKRPDVPLEGLEAGICPACPYPEGGADGQPARPTRKRKAKAS